MTCVGSGVHMEISSPPPQSTRLHRWRAPPRAQGRVSANIQHVSADSFGSSISPPLPLLHTPVPCPVEKQARAEHKSLFDKSKRCVGDGGWGKKSGEMRGESRCASAEETEWKAWEEGGIKKTKQKVKCRTGASAKVTREAAKVKEDAWRRIPATGAGEGGWVFWWQPANALYMTLYIVR